MTSTFGLNAKEASHLNPSSSVPGLRQCHLCQPRDIWSKFLVFFASKKSDTSTEKTSTAKKPLVVVVHIRKTLLEIISLEKENLEANEGENIEPDF